ncbi:MAG: hypothetical protein ACM65L_21070 [Microcoleus sp.]
MSKWERSDRTPFNLQKQRGRVVLGKGDRACFCLLNFLVRAIA